MTPGEEARVKDLEAEIERLRDLLGRVVYLADANPNADGRDLWKSLCEHPDLLPAIDAELETKE